MSTVTTAFANLTVMGYITHRPTTKGVGRLHLVKFLVRVPQERGTLVYNCEMDVPDADTAMSRCEQLSKPGVRVCLTGNMIAMSGKNHNDGSVSKWETLRVNTLAVIPATERVDLDTQPT